MTLVELSFALAIVAVLVGMAAPGFRSSLRAAAVRSATFELLAGLQQSRGNAILRSKPAQLCPSDEAGNCRPSYTSSTHWRNSVDGDAGGASPAGHALPPGIVVRATRSPLSFLPDALGASTGTLTICDTYGVAPPRAIVLSLSGRARLASATPGACG